MFMARIYSAAGRVQYQSPAAYPSREEAARAAGLNYAEHVIEAARKRGQEPNLPQAADIGYRANNALIAHGEAPPAFHYFPPKKGGP